MIRYAQWRPTGFDHRGAFLLDRQDWWVAPVIQSRDSGPLERSNFVIALQMLGGEQENSIEVHRFGHWGPGWIEIILVKPNKDREGFLFEIEKKLADYPILNEDHFGDLEWEEAANYWEQCSLKERIELLQRAGLSIFAARRSEFPNDPAGRLYERLTSN